METWRDASLLRVIRIGFSAVYPDKLWCILLVPHYQTIIVERNQVDLASDVAQIEAPLSFVVMGYGLVSVYLEDPIVKSNQKVSFVSFDDIIDVVKIAVLPNEQPRPISLNFLTSIIVSMSMLGSHFFSALESRCKDSTKSPSNWLRSWRRWSLKDLVKFANSTSGAPLSVRMRTLS